ncbi:nitroreductase family protein [Porphyromonas sp. COT-290 OH860]|uniref:nitroreductase family protein n=1 Tax=Porphyromonas sp. COT-290 OH860 TaxID=1515615 RepID=UPI00052BF2DD|nr:nitroreductase family protein [Porphyromonas sp. COT-290 OH860]KGN85040.1 nitroreductase [Porphyromonas sp. COT-290 OH860]
MKSLKEILEFRRATRRYSDQPIDTERVRECIKLAQLSPTSSNMQLYEVYHVTDKALLGQLAVACFGQGAASTAQQMVVFVARQDLHRARAKAMLAYERENVKLNSPQDRQEHRLKRWELYYGRVMPLLNSRCLGIWGVIRKSFAQCIGLFRPMIRQVSEADVRVSVHQSCGMVAQTFIIAMAEAGYDTCPIGGFDSLRVRRLLNLPSGAEIGMIVSCGIRDPRGIWGDRVRIPFEQMYKHR